MYLPNEKKERPGASDQNLNKEENDRFGEADLIQEGLKELFVYNDFQLYPSYLLEGHGQLDQDRKEENNWPPPDHEDDQESFLRRYTFTKELDKKIEEEGAAPYKIGPLTPEQRKVKIERYLRKRKIRCFQKKVSYDCRKRVADERIRVKGRFVKREQALQLLGLPPCSTLKESVLKEMLGQSLGKRVQLTFLNCEQKKEEHADEKQEHSEEE